MTQPIGYYVSANQEDSALLNEMEKSWGSRFEALNNCQRLWIINMLSDDLYHEPDIYEDHELDDEVFDFMDRRHELTISQQVQLIRAIIDQVKGV